MNQYKVILNSDRVHLSLNGSPVATYLFSQFGDDETEAKNIAIGFAVNKLLGEGCTSVIVEDKSE